jgi:hypothetical protein
MAQQINLRIFYEDFGDIKNGFDSEPLDLCGYTPASRSYPVLDYPLDNLGINCISEEEYNVLSNVRYNLNEDGSPNIEFLESLSREITIGHIKENNQWEKKTMFREVLKAELLYYYEKGKPLVNHFSKKEAEDMIDRFISRYD